MTIDIVGAEINADGIVHTKVFIDGKEIENITHLEYEVIPGELPILKLEIIAGKTNIKSKVRLEES